MNWTKNVLNREVSDGVNALTETVALVYEDLFDCKMVDLRDLPLDQVNSVHLAVVLRATADLHRDFSSLVVGWDEALKLAKIAAVRDGHDPNEILLGML